MDQLYTQLNPEIKSDFIREQKKTVLFYSNNIIWTILFLYPLLGIIDYIYLPDIWLQVLFIRIISVLLFYSFYDISRRSQRSIIPVLHFMMGIISLTYAVLCNIARLEDMSIFFLVYSSIFMLFNLVVFWESRNSVFQLILAIIFVVGFYGLFNPYSFGVFFEQGAGLFFIIAVFSTFIPQARYGIILRDINSRLQIRLSNLRLAEKNEEIIQQNHIIEENNRKLVKLDQRKNSSMQVAEHDLRNFVGAMITTTNLFKMEDMTAEQKEYVDIIEQSATKMQYMLNKLLSIEEDNKVVEFNYELFDINTEVHKAINNLDDASRIKNILLEDRAQYTAVMINLDKVFTGQILHNMISNALKFSEENNRIVVSTKTQDGKYIVEIIDEGNPIGQKTLEEMFNKLQHLSETPASGENRSGLGFSIARLMIVEMNGKLTYRSDEDGNYYKIEFPLN